MSRITICASIVLAAVAGAVWGQTVIPVNVTEVSLGTVESAEPLPYLIVDMPVLEEPKDSRVAEAYLEFLMDVSSTLAAQGAGNSVTIEAFPYLGTTDGKLDVSALGSSSIKRTVNAGNERLVRLRVTDFVRHILASPETDHRLIVGSITGTRTARFDAKELPSARGAKTVLEVYFMPAKTATANQTD